MRITVLKSTVETALTPILKMVASAKLPAEFHPTLTFQSDKQSLSIGCSLPDQQLSVALPDAAFNEKNAAFDVSLDIFNGMSAATIGTRFSIEQDAAHVRLNCDDHFIGQLVPMTSKPNPAFLPTKDADMTVLPTNFANFVLQAFTCASDDTTRVALTGVNISPRGMAGTDGHQLFHLPLPLQLKQSVTIPQSKVYASLKHLRWTSLAHWRTAGNDWMFAISGDGFRYAAKALVGTYPQYWQVIPPEEGNDVRFTLTPDGTQALQRFLNENTHEANAKLTVHPDRIELLETNNTDLKQRSGVFASISQSARLPCTVHIISNNLRQFLKMGFRTLSFSSKMPSPLVSSEGIGKYLFMPVRDEYANTAATAATPATPATTSVTKPEARPESRPATVTTSSTDNPITPQPHKEKTTMTQTLNPTAAQSGTIPSTFTRTLPQPTVAAPSNPLEETLANVAAMREALDSLNSRLLEAGRKLKAALIEQKQKERQYAEANRKLERIRLAV
ncbi:MAG: hypothetical protein IJT83_10240 [Victivallales bacterium]|nr:hypothetical protein [Victivallales bacterium]